MTSRTKNFTIMLVWVLISLSSENANSQSVDKDKAKSSALRDVTNHTWTDVRGREIRGKFVELTEQDVVLDIDGKLSRVLLSKLSKQSDELAKKLASTSNIRIKVLVLNYDPFFEGKRLHETLHFNDPRKLADGYKEDLIKASGGFLEFMIVEWRDLDEIYAREDGGRYTVEEYVRNRRASKGWPAKIVADYPRLLAEQDVVPLIDAGTVDEVWIFGDHYFGLWEASMAGPGAFFINGGVYPQVASKRPFAFYGFNYERGVAEMLHNTAHRTESTMNRIYGQWNLKDPSNNWEKFSANANQSNGVAGVGTCHWPANATFDYDYANSRTVESWADDFLTYPNLTGKKSPVSSKSWSRDGADPHRGYMKWYFERLPKADGINADGRLNNWWRYIYEFDTYQRDGKQKRDPLNAKASQTQIAKWVIESGGSVGLVGRSDWIQDIKAIPKNSKLRISRISFFPTSKPESKISALDLEALRSVSDLEELILRGQPIGDAGLAIIAKMHKLKVLNLHDCQISDEALNDIGALKLLMSLDIGFSNNRITDAGAEQLAKLKMLTELNIYNSKITDATLLEILAKLPRLRSVELTQTQVSAKGIEEFKRKKPECQVINHQ